MKCWIVVVLMNSIDTHCFNNELNNFIVHKIMVQMTVLLEYADILFICVAFI